MSGRRWPLLGVAFLVACSTPAPALDDFDVDAAAELRPLLTPEAAARVAVNYLAAHQPPLGAGNEKVGQDIGDVTLARAPEAPSFEGDMPAAVARAAGPSFLVWIVTFRDGSLVGRDERERAEQRPDPWP
jgi:hypothetical protein